MQTDYAKDRSVPKLVGADFELANFILGVERSNGTGPEAARALLAEIDPRAAWLTLNQRVRIQQQDMFSARERKGAVVGLREPEVRPILQNPDLRKGLSDPFQRPVGAPVVAQDDLGIDAFESSRKRL